MKDPIKSNSKPRGRPVKNTMPEPIPDTPENIARALLTTPPKKEDEWDYLKEREIKVAGALLRRPQSAEKKECPECGHVFQGDGWDGIDAHWRSKHEDIMSYEDAWPSLRDGKYAPPESN